MSVTPKVPAAASPEPAAPVSVSAAKPAVRRTPARKKPAQDPVLEEARSEMAKAAAVAEALSEEAAKRPRGKPDKPAQGEEGKKSARPEKTGKAKKPRLVRDGYTMPEAEHEEIAVLKKRLQKAGVAAKKSEILRAGLLLLVAQSDDALSAALAKVEKIKTGRPARK